MADNSASEQANEPEELPGSQSADTSRNEDVPSQQTAESAKSQPKQPRDMRTMGLLGVILVLGMFLRFWGIGWSLPDTRHYLSTYHPDERINLNVAKNADIPHLQFDIGFYNYGTLYFYGVSLAQTIGRGYGAIPGENDLQPNKTGPEAKATEQAGLFLAGRLLTALLGTATIAVLFALGNRMFGKATGLLAALLYAIAPLAAVHAHFLTVDVPATFFVSLALLWSARLLTMPTWREYALAGVWVGLAAATKYNVGLVLIAPVVAHCLNLAPGTRRKHRAAQLVVFLAVTLLTFLIACPGPILNFDAFWNGLGPDSQTGVRYELFEHSRSGHGDLFINTGPGWWYHLAISLRFGLGVPLLLAALVGIGVAFQRRTPADKILLAFFLLYYLATGFSAVRFARYMIPLFPVLCLLAARLFTDESLAWFKPWPRRLTAALTLLLTFGYTATLVHAMTVKDPRDVAADYLEQNAPQGASIAFGKTPWFYSPPLSRRFGSPAAPDRAKAADETTRYQLRISPNEWDKSVLQPPPDYIILSNLETLHPRRLHEAAEMQFEQAIPSDYRRTEFTPPYIFDMSFGGALVPEDLLYILPHLTLYQKPGD